MQRNFLAEGWEGGLRREVRSSRCGAVALSWREQARRAQEGGAEASPWRPGLQLQAVPAWDQPMCVVREAGQVSLWSREAAEALTIL